jgi:hypothetical protein
MERRSPLSHRVLGVHGQGEQVSEVRVSGSAADGPTPVVLGNEQLQASRVDLEVERGGQAQSFAVDSDVGSSGV